MKYIFTFFFISYSLYLTAIQLSPETNTLIEKTKQDYSLNVYLSNFPFNEYQVCSVEHLGHFHIDNIPDAIKQHLKQGIYWESTIGILVKMFTIPNTIVIDLGAHIGIHTITMSKKVGPNGLVIAFEPQFKLYRELFFNLHLNNCNHNVITLRNAVGDVAQMCEMTVSDPINEGGTPIGKGGDPVEMLTLDSLNLSNVSLIKMDVESYEFKVLQGAQQTLLSNRPVIIFEILGGYDLDYCTDEIKAQYHDIVNFLISLDYRVERIWGNDFIALPNNKY